MNKVYQNIFLYGLNFSYILYFIVMLGISSLVPKYLSYLRVFLKIYIALLLIYFYNPLTYREKKFTNFDRKLVFSAGIFLLLSTTIVDSVELFLKEKLN
jgi:cytochrome c biogenesis protein CcdA